MPGSQTTNSVTTNNAVTYTLTVMDANGCKDTTIHIVKLSNPFVYAPDVNYCVGQTGNANAVGSGTAPVTYVWNPGNVSGATYSTISPGTYTVTFTDAYGCTSSDVVVVTENPLPVADFTTTPSMPVEEDQVVTFINQSSVPTGNVSSSIWDFGDLQGAIAFQPSHIYESSGFYQVSLIVISNKGCTDTISKTIEILPTVIPPNIFTPNGDGINEFLAFKNLEYYPNSSIYIYNRWGKLLYSDSNYQNNWKGEGYSEGTYYYILKVKATDKEFNGFFQLAR
jgi:gliding motility-associated-like protein